MDKEDKIYIAGHHGLVGSAIMHNLEVEGYKNIVTRTHSELDLTDQRGVYEFFYEESPDYVFLCAAKVGGIYANSTYPAEFIRENLEIQTHIIHESWRSGVKRLLFMGSSCIYPKESPQPIKEDYLLAGPLEPTNQPYALAKISGIEMCWSYNRQYRTEYIAVMPTNLYGIGDNYDLENSHVMPALIRKMHEAKINNNKEVVVWGTGKPLREFMYNDDMAGASIHVMNLPDYRIRELLSNEVKPPLINIGVGKEISIRNLAEMVKSVTGFNGDIVWDKTKPDGAMRKLLDISKLASLGWKPRVGLREGLEKAYNDYLNN